MFLTDMLALCHVPRWVIVDHSRPQSVAEHSFRVAAITVELAKRLNISITVPLLAYALSHDFNESRTGDIPSTAKSMFKTEAHEELFGEKPYPIMEELRLVKLADLIEAYTFIMRYGIGGHADSVARSIEAKINDGATWGSDQVGAARSIVRSILGDEGRYQGPAPAHRVEPKPPQGPPYESVTVYPTSKPLGRLEPGPEWPGPGRPETAGGRRP